MIREKFDLGGRVAIVTGAGRGLGTLEDIGALALYLASPASDWITGRMFQLDGGIGFEPLEYEGVFPIE